MIEHCRQTVGQRFSILRLLKMRAGFGLRISEPALRFFEHIGWGEFFEL